MPIPFPFDFKNPDYNEVYEWRAERLRRIRENPEEMLPVLDAFYRDNPWQFITDWGVTHDPRNVERGLPAFIPFVLFPRQEEWVQWLLARWQSQEHGLTDKSRDGGLSWLMIGAAFSIGRSYEGMSIGFGSRKEEYVDSTKNPKAIFFRMRMFIKNLPREFRGGFDPKKHAAHMRIEIPDSHSTITGEAGDNIGRGDRAGIFLLDESAYIERPQLVDASLSQTTNCRIDVSSVNGSANPFAEKRHRYPPHQVFTLHWRQDPRKTEEWYAKQCAVLDAVIVAQEIDINYAASVDRIVIPSEWIQAAIDSHIKLGFSATGKRSSSLDVADTGKDENANAARHGILLRQADGWSGQGSDIFATTALAFMHCDDYGTDELIYDADGLGAGVRGDARTLNVGRTRKLEIVAFWGSGAVVNPDEPIPSALPIDEPEDITPDRTNADFFANAKAQAWWELRMRFRRTFLAVTTGRKFDPDDLISLSGTLPALTKLCMELAQPTWTQNNVGKILIDKQPDGTRSPNLADSVMMLYAPRQEQPRGFFDM